MKRKRYTPLGLLTLLAKAWVIVILAIIVVVLAYIIVWKIARILSQMAPSGSKTNQTDTYYSTNYNYEPYIATGFISQVTNPPSFTLFYGYSSLDNHPWVSLTNNMVTAGGQSVDLINNSTEYKVSINLGTYSVVYDYDAQTGLQIGSGSNGTVTVIIQKSSDLLHWQDAYTNTGTVQDTVNDWTDDVVTNERAFYRAVDK